MLPLVSVIIPVYGVERYVERCVRSVVTQSYQNLEIIIVDDCTPDRSVAIINAVLQEFPYRKRQTQIIHHEQNLGLAGARATGLFYSSGKYLLQVDSDDFIATEMVSMMVNAAEKNDADITICDFNYVYGNDNVVWKHVSPPTNNIDCMNDVLMGRIHASVCNKLIKSSLYQEHDITPTVGLNMWEDLSVMYKLMFFANKITYVPAPLYNYVLETQGSYTSEKMPYKYQLNAYQLIGQMDDFKSKEVVSAETEQAFVSRIAILEALIVMYGDIRDFDLNKSLFKDVTFKIAFTHPYIDVVLKLALVCELLNFRFGLRILKFVRSVKNKLRH